MAVLLLGPIACSSSTSPVEPANDSGTDSGHDDAGLDAKSDAPNVADCGVIEFLPPVLTVASKDGTTIPCAADFTVVGVADGGTIPPDGGAGATLCGPSGSSFQGCPTPLADGGQGACAYALLGIENSIVPYTIEVAQAGFESQTVNGVTAGGGAVCGSGLKQPTIETVTLTPVLDASTDAPDDAADAH